MVPKVTNLVPKVTNLVPKVTNLVPQSDEPGSPNVVAGFSPRSEDPAPEKAFQVRDSCNTAGFPRSRANDTTRSRRPSFPEPCPAAWPCIRCGALLRSDGAQVCARAGDREIPNARKVSSSRTPAVPAVSARHILRPYHRTGTRSNGRGVSYTHPASPAAPGRNPGSIN